MRKLIIFEGIDGSGKTTLENAYRKFNEFYDYTMHRFTGSKYVYDHYYSRQINIQQLLKDEMNLSRNFQVRLVWVDTNPSISRERVISRGEEPQKDMFYSDTQKLFYNYYMLTRFKAKMRIDTHNKSVDRCVGQIAYWIGLPFEEACIHDS